MVYVGTCDWCENIKTKLWSTISILKPWHIEIFCYKKKMIVKSSTTFCKMLDTCCYWGIPHITLSAEKISHMPFYYVEDVYHKNQLGTLSVEKEV